MVDPFVVDDVAFVLSKINDCHPALAEFARDPVAIGQRPLQPLEELGHPNRLRPRCRRQQYGAPLG